MTEDPWQWWREAIAGNVGPVHDQPWCGYFKVRDRRGLNKNLAPVKRPWIVCAIWIVDGEFKAELAGAEVPVDKLWPYVARHPIPFETYAYWHEHDGEWPSEEKAA